MRSPKCFSISASSLNILAVVWEYLCSQPQLGQLGGFVKQNQRIWTLNFRDFISNSKKECHHLKSSNARRFYGKLHEVAQPCGLSHVAAQRRMRDRRSRDVHHRLAIERYLGISPRPEILIY